MRFILYSGDRRVVFDRAPMRSHLWDEQKKGFRFRLGLPEHGSERR